MKREAGYALTEVLVASAIAGAVLAAGMSAFASNAAGLRQSAQAQEAGLVARNIEARMRAGLSPGLAVDGYDGWQVTLSSLEVPRDPVTGARLSRVDIRGPDGFQISAVMVVDGQGRR